MPTDNKLESLKILIESLKLYFAYSSSLLLASIAFIASTTKQFTPIVISSVICLLLAAILAIVNINHFIRHVKNGNYNIEARSPRVLNFICIVLFGLGTIGILKYFLFDHSASVAATPTKEQAETSITVKDGAARIRIERKQTGLIKRVIVE